MLYKASADNVTKSVTIGVIVLFIVLGQMELRALMAAKGEISKMLLHAGLLIFFVALLFGS